MSRRLRMESSGSIVHTNNGNLQNYYTNLEDMIDLYSEEAKGVAEKPHEEWVSDAGDNAYGYFPDSNEVTEKIKACVKCTEDFKTDQELQSHSCTANQNENNNPTRVYFINLADSTDTDDENEVPNELKSLPRKKNINCQNNTENTKSVRPKGGLKTLDLENDIPIIIDDVNECINYKPTKIHLNNKTKSKQNTENNVSINSEIYLKPKVIIIDDDSTNNSEIVPRNEDDIVLIDDASVLKDNPLELTNNLISDNIEDLRFISFSPTNVNIVTESSEEEIDYEKLSKVLENVSTDLRTMLGPEEIESNNLDIPLIINEENNHNTGVNEENGMPNIDGSVNLKVLANKKDNESNTVETRSLRKLNEKPYFYIEDGNRIIYLGNKFQIKRVDIIKNTKINMNSVNPKIVLDNGMDVEDSNTLASKLLENDMPNIHDSVNIKLLANKKDNESNTVVTRNIQELNELPYLDSQDSNRIIYLENGIQIKRLDIMKHTKINVNGVDPEIILENGVDVEDSNALASKLCGKDMPNIDDYDDSVNMELSANKKDNESNTVETREIQELNELPYLDSEDSNRIIYLENGIQIKRLDIMKQANKKDNELNTVETRNIQEVNELPYWDIEDANRIIYLENGIPIKRLDIIKDTKININGVDPEIVLDNGMDVEDSNALASKLLENDFVSTVLGNDVVLPLDSKIYKDFGDIKGVVDLESVILESNIDMVDLEDANSSVIIEKVLEGVKPEAVSENDHFDPKTLENRSNVLDPNVIEDSIKVVDPQPNSEIDLNLLHPKSVIRISSNMEVDDPNIITAMDLEDFNSNVAVGNYVTIVDSNNVEIDYFTKDSESNMQALESKVILKKGIQIEVSSFLSDEGMESVNSNLKSKTKTQPKNND